LTLVACSSPARPPQNYRTPVSPRSPFYINTRCLPLHFSAMAFPHPRPPVFSPHPTCQALMFPICKSQRSLAVPFYSTSDSVLPAALHSENPSRPMLSLSFDARRRTMSMIMQASIFESALTYPHLTPLLSVFYLEEPFPSGLSGLRPSLFSLARNCSSLERFLSSPLTSC